jgi:hypothetical protein
LERGVRPIGDWSTLITLSNRSRPIDFLVRRRLAGRAVEVLAAAAYSVSLISVDLPEPETPVMQVSRPTGIRA